MITTIQTLVLLLGVIAVVAFVAARLTIPPAILLVLTGVVLALIPGLPTVQLDPKFVLLLVLPPIVYSSAVAMSWREFRFNLRPISLLAIGCVIFTTIGVAAASHFLLRLSWPVSFVLGAIVSPPDVVAPLSIAERMQLPRRILVILQGEGLANDATALILYRFAVTAVSAGAFSIGQAAASFAAILVGEVFWGVGVAWLMLRLRRWVRDPRIEILLSILMPFIAYWPPEQLGGSGVLATVTAGLYISWNGLWLIGAATRLQGIFFWDFFIYVIEGMVFLITGLQARRLFGGIGHYSTYDLILSAGIVCAVVIGTRFVWVYPASYLSRLIPAIARNDPPPPWQSLFVIAFTGVRGIVSLAAALAIPFRTSVGQAFPGRDLILFLAFSVILVTLVGQGLSLPFVIRGLGLAHAGRRERQTDKAEQFKVRRQAVEAVMGQLERLAAERKFPEEVVAPIRAYHRERLKRVVHRSDDDDGHKKLTRLRDDLDTELIAAERNLINDLYREGKLKSEARRRLERELDLRETHSISVRAEE